MNDQYNNNNNPYQQPQQQYNYQQPQYQYQQPQYTYPQPPVVRESGLGGKGIVAIIFASISAFFYLLTVGCGEEEAAIALFVFGIFAMIPAIIFGILTLVSGIKNKIVARIVVGAVVLGIVFFFFFFGVCGLSAYMGYEYYDDYYYYY